MCWVRRYIKHFSLSRSVGLHARRPHVGPVLTDRHRSERRRWTGSYRRWRLQRCHGVLFSDQIRSEWLTCTFRASCCSARLSRAQVPPFAGSSVRDRDVFSNESSFHLKNADGRLWAWRGECYHNDCFVQTDRWMEVEVLWCRAGSPNSTLCMP